MRSPLNTLLQILFQLLLLPIWYLPGHAGNALRYHYYKHKLKHLGQNVMIDVGVQIQNPQYISIGDNTWIDRYVILLAGRTQRKRETLHKPNLNYRFGPGELHVGNNVHIGPFTIISAIGGVQLGDDVTLSAGCKVYSFSHHYRSFQDPSNRSFAFGSMVAPERQSMLSSPVVFENNTGMALNGVVLPGVTVGRDSFVMINAVVTKNVPPNSLVAGHPAKVVDERFVTVADSPGY
ncbi:MAG: acyltransferase [Ardenticatenaceae bacterium]|nr:acyltransferase [Ardenticatenaceae bacterium]